MVNSHHQSQEAGRHESNLEKKIPIVSQTKVDDSSLVQGRPWIAGIARRFPWISFICLLSTATCCAGIIAILRLSNEKGTDEFCTAWVTVRGRLVKVQVTVNVWISLLMFFAGKFLAVAYGEAVTMSWWIDAMKGQTLLQLHHHWEVSRSVTSIIRRPRLFSWVCAASLCYTCFSGLGIILQESSTIVAQTDKYRQKQFEGVLATQLPMGWSMFENHLSDAMAGVFYNYTKREAIHFDLKNCSPTSNVSCDATLLGVGFNYSCAADLHLVDTTAKANNSVTLFRTHVDMNNNTAWALNMSIIFKEDKECVVLNKTASVKTRTCTLVPALVKYPVRVTNGIVILRDAQTDMEWQGKSISVSKRVMVDTVVSDLTWRGGCTNQSIVEGHCIPWEKDTNHYEHTTLMGINKTISVNLRSDFSLNWAGLNRWQSLEDCSEANGFCMFTQGSYSPADHDPCKRSFLDPTQTMISNIRDIMFRSSVAIAQMNISDSSDWMKDNLINGKPNGKTSFQIVLISQNTIDNDGELTMLHSVYKTNTSILSIGVSLMLLITFITGTLFWGFWKLGRVVTMSPLETARALQPINSIAAPAYDGMQNLRRAPTTNATLIDIVHAVGDVKLRYGVTERRQLVVDLHDQVHKPMQGEIYR